MDEAFDGWGRVGLAGLWSSCSLIVEGDGGKAELARGVDLVGGGMWVREEWVGEGRGEGLDCVALQETLGDGSGSLNAFACGLAVGRRLCSEYVGWGVE